MTIPMLRMTIEIKRMDCADAKVAIPFLEFYDQFSSHAEIPQAMLPQAPLQRQFCSLPRVSMVKKIKIDLRKMGTRMGLRQAQRMRSGNRRWWCWEEKKYCGPKNSLKMVT